jgi:pimeloyl-ACP methyl ester carboxylesterase
MGKGVHAFYLFEPAGPVPKKAAVIVLNHGYAAIDPVGYGAWIRHMVRRGNIVIYPVYQAGLYTSRFKLASNAIQGVKDALKELKNGKHVQPIESRFAIVGHSAGGIITANMAATWQATGLPKPRAVMCVQPGISRMFPLADLSLIPKETLLLTMAGDSDRVTGRRDAKLIYQRATNVPAANKNYVLLQSDTNGAPNLRATNLLSFAVLVEDAKAVRAVKYRLRSMFGEKKEKVNNANGGVDKTKQGQEALLTDGMDFFGTWKLFDGLCDAAFYGKHREYALGNTAKQRFMGKWSDGKAVRELVVEHIPAGP